MLITLGPSAGVAVGTLHDVPWPQLVAWLQQHPRPLSPIAADYARLVTFGSASPEGRQLAAAKDGPWISFAAFTGNYRHLSSSPRGCAVPIDLDHSCFTAETIAATLHGYTWAAYTTFGHTAAAPRWRVIIPVSTELDAATHRATWSALNEMFGGIADPSAKDITRLNYLPGDCVDPAQATVIWADGTLFPSMPAPPDAALAAPADSDGPVSGWCGPLDDGELLRRVFSMRTRPEERFGNTTLIEALWRGDADALAIRYPSREPAQAWDYTRADMALANELSYYTGRDRGRCLALMLQAGCVTTRGEPDSEMERKLRYAVSRAVTREEVYAWPKPVAPVVPAVTISTEGIDPVALAAAPGIPANVTAGLASLPLSYKPNGQLAPTLTNITMVLAHPSMNRLAFDTFRGETMIAPACTEEWRPIDDVIVTRLLMEFERLNFASITVDYMRRALDEVAARHQFDSAIRWLESLPPWDGVERINQFFIAYAGAADSDYVRAVGAYLWTALAGRVLVPGVKADMAPVLISRQGRCKTWSLQSIAPHADHYVEVSLLDRDTDLARMLRGKLVGEIGELRGLGKRDMEAVKTFMSRQHEQWIPKYKEFAITYPRRLVFVGTTNQAQFLEDETGNRRWLPLEVAHLNRDKIIADRDQLWAEAAARFHASGVAWQDAEQLAPAQHAQHMVTDSWEANIERWLREPDSNVAPGATPPPPPGERQFHMSDVLRGALQMPTERMNRAAEQRAGRILKGLGFISKATRQPNGKIIQLWSASYNPWL